MNDILDRFSPNELGKEFIKTIEELYMFEVEVCKECIVGPICDNICQPCRSEILKKMSYE